MSIVDEITAQVHAKRLYHIVPELPGLSVKRDVFASESVYEFLTGEGDTAYSRVGGKAKAKIDRFISGAMVTLALDPHDKSRTSFLARNDPVAMGIVDVRITDPQPMVRIFGGFAAKDVLVLLKWHPRAGLQFQRAVIDCRRLWNDLFDNQPPMIGESHEHYISGHFEIG